MEWQKIVLVIYIAIGVLLNVITIGKPRKPIEASTVAIAMVLSGLVVWVILSI